MDDLFIERLIRTIGSLLLTLAALVALSTRAAATNYEFQGAAAQDGVIGGDSCSYFRGRAIVRVASGIDLDSAAAILQGYNVSPYTYYMLGGYIWCAFDTLRNVDSVLTALEDDGAIAEAWPDYLCEFPSYPDDPYFDNDSELVAVQHRGCNCGSVGVAKLHQWNLAFNGEYASPAPDSPFVHPASHMRVRPAWDITTGDTSVHILHLDVGIRHVGGVVNHEDLDTAHVKVGRNYLSQNPNSLALGDTLKAECNYAYHGTQSSGIISATINNGKGVAGISPGCILTAASVGGPGSVVSAMLDACTTGVDIVSTDVAIWFPDSLRQMEFAVRRLDSLDILVTGAHGNTHDCLNMPVYFAYWDSANGIGGGYDNVINVNALRMQAYPLVYHTADTLAVTVIAPGAPESIPSVHQAGYDCYSYIGHTSAATPQVAGVAALVMSHFGTGAKDTRDIIIGSADKLWKDSTISENPSLGWQEYFDDDYHSNYGYGRVNAFRALNGWNGTLASCDTAWSTSTLFAGDNRVYIADITIDPTCTLTVDAGIEVRAVTTDVVDGTETGGPAGYPCELIVDGRLVIDGSPSDSVLFSSTNDSLLPAWYGIRVRDGGVLSIRHATIANAKVGITVENGGSLDTLIDVHFVNCETAIKLESDTLLLLRDVVIAGSDSVAVVCPEGAELRVLGAFDVQGDASHKAVVACTNDSTVGAWDGIHVTSAGSIGFSYVDVRNAATAILVDSGGVVDTPVVNCTISDCEVAFEVRTGTLVLRDVAMTGVQDYGIDASVGSAVIRLQDSVAIVGVEDVTTAVSVSSGGKLVAVGTVVQDGYLGFEIRGDAVDTVKGCKFTDLTWSALYFSEGAGTDYSSGNVIEKSGGGSVEYGYLILDQSVTSVGDTIRGGYVKNIYFVGEGYSFDTQDLYVRGKVGDDYGLFVIGNSSTELTLDQAKIDSFFTTAHLYIYGGDAEILESRFVTHASSSDASPYGIWDRITTSGHVRCSDILNQRTACVMRDDTSCNLIWDGYGIQHQETAGWNAIKTSHSGAFYVKNTTTDTVDFRKNWWGGGAAGSSRMSGKIKYTDYVTDSGQCGPVYYKPATETSEATPTLPLVFQLEQNIPNPFNPTTEIRYALPFNQPATLTIFNVLGRVVRQVDLGMLPAGYGSLTWRGDDNAGREVGSGLYFYRFSSPAFTETKKMLLLR